MQNHQVNSHHSSRLVSPQIINTVSVSVWIILMLSKDDLKADLHV